MSQVTARVCFVTKLLAILAACPSFARPIQACGPGPGSGPFTTPHEPMKRPATNYKGRSGVSGAQYRARLQATQAAEVQLVPGAGLDLTAHEVGNYLVAFKAWKNQVTTEAETQTVSEDLAYSALLWDPTLVAKLSTVAEVVRRRRITQKTGPGALAPSTSSVGAVFGRLEGAARGAGSGQRSQ